MNRSNVPAVRVADLVKTYGSVRALDGLDIEVPQGNVVGLLGPNGAGKTTCVRVLATLLRPDAGRAEVCGIDVLQNPRQVRERIGLSGQYAAVDEYLTGFENLDMVGRLYHLGRTPARRRARELLGQFDLEDSADRPVRTYSGGMRRRLDLAAALVARPQVLFLDEPTTGLDPRSRTGMWQILSELVAEGTTVLLTTQYLEEADRLADSIVVIDHGRVIAQGTSDELKAKVGGEVVEVVVAEPTMVSSAVAALSRMGQGRPVAEDHTRKVSMSISGVEPGATVLVETLRRLDAEAVRVLDVAVRRPTLDDVFLSLTGHAAEDGEDASEVGVGTGSGRGGRG